VSVPLSVRIPTLAEELNLPECLASVAWADQVFVVDSFSRDRTLEIARTHGAHVVQHAFENYARQKNWALDCLPFRHEWVLILDADERVTPELRIEIESAIASTRYAGYYLNRRFYFLGQWIRHAGWYPSWNLRLFRHALGRYEDRPVHEHVVLDGPTGYLRNDLLHLDRRAFSAFIDRHNRYSSFEAEARLVVERRHGTHRLSPKLLGSPVERKRFLRERVWPSLPFKPLVLFVYMYVVRRGFLDGRPGLILCVFHAWQEFVVGIKLAELQSRGREVERSRDDVVM
jgi:glycosyltransferase involved in cell wall biosynthesis